MWGWQSIPNKRYLKRQKQWMIDVWQKTGGSIKILWKDDLDWLRSYLFSEPEEYYKIDFKRKAYK